MILSTGRRYLFIHIPKTGGTAMALALEARAMKDDIMLGDTPKARRRRRRLADAPSAGRLWKHSTRRDIAGLLPEEALNDLFAFTLVRNPWDRAVSYFHWLQTQSFDHSAVELAKSLEFTDFVQHPRIRSVFRATPAGWYMRRPDRSEHCDLFIRIEHLDADAEPLFEHLGFRLDVPRVNMSAREADYRTYYTTPAADAVAEACAEDIARFGYGFG